MYPLIIFYLTGWQQINVRMSIVFIYLDKLCQLALPANLYNVKYPNLECRLFMVEVTHKTCENVVKLYHSYIL